MIFNKDTIDLIEDNLNAQRTSEVCQQINDVIDLVWCISLRKCTINDANFEKLIKTVSKCKMLRYLNLNLHMIDSFERVTFLSSCIASLFYLDTICLHSSNLRDDGLKLLVHSISNLRNLRSIDIGDCQLSDNAVPFIRELIHGKEGSIGLSELIISSNPIITPIGWSKILIAVTASSTLKNYHMDYNNLDDSCGYIICAMISTNRNLEVLDLEHTGLTNKSAILILYLVKTYKLDLKCLNLMYNPIDENLLEQIRHYIKNDYEVDNSVSPSTYKVKSEKIYENKNDNSFQNMHLRDQNRINNLVKNGMKYTDKTRPDYDPLAYERALERDMTNLSKYEKKLTHINKTEQLEESDKEADLLKPFDDFRFKSHTVLPFNLKNV